MIQKAELKRVAEIKKLPIRACEKDYVLELVLYAISDMKRSLVFKGGTALYKFYNLNRFSEDLDFNMTGKRLGYEDIVQRIERSLGLMGMSGTLSEVEDHRNEMNIRLKVRGPLYDGNRSSMTRIILNLSKRERPETRELKMLIPSFQDIPSFETAVMMQDEIASEKYRCIMTRDKPRDIYDLWFLLKRGAGPEKDMIDRKLGMFGLRYERENLLTRVRSMERMWAKDLRGLVIGTLPDINSVLDELSVWVQR